MAFSFIDEEDLVERFNDSMTYMLPLFKPLDEFERIARNQPHPGIDKSLPKVTDGTLAAFIQELPKRIIQRIPTGNIISNDRWFEIIADYILEHEIIANANTTAALIQKCWALTSKSLTYGSQPAFVQFVNRGDYFGTDFTLPYIKDVLLEQGKLSDRDSNVIFLKAWYQPNQIDAIIKKEDMLTKNSQDRKDAEAYASGWDLKELANLKDKIQQKDNWSLTPNERNKMTNKGFIEIVHCFQRGIGAEFYSFSPVTKQVVRRRKNKDPRGMIPIHYMYANVDLSNPLGRGSVEVSGGMQNLLDSEVQSYQYMRSLLMNPPLEIKGNVPTSVVKYAPNALWKVGSDPNASITPVKLETASLQAFPQNYGLIKGQIMALNSAGDNTVPAQSGNASSKTPQGVDAQQMHLGLSDNYMRRQFESTFEEIINTMLNLYFAERSGTQEIKIDVETADKLRDIDESPNKLQYVNKDNVCRINYDSETPKLDFKADPTSSTIEDNQEQIAVLQEVLAEAAKNPYIPYLMQSVGKELHIGEVYKQLFERLGVKDMDKIVTDLEKDPQTGQVKAPSVMTPFFDKPHLTAVYKDLPPAAQVQLLANGGVNVQISDVLQPNIDQIAGGRLQNPVQPAYVDQQTGQIVSGHPQNGEPYVDPQTGQPVPQQAAQPQAQPSISDHPILQMMNTLQIKFADLPEDSQHEVLAALGIPTSGMATPASQKMQVEQSNAAVKVAELAHKQQTTDNAHILGASAEALKVAQLHHTMNQAQATNAQAQATHDLAVNNAAQAGEQAAASHELAVQTAKKPMAKAGAAK